MSNDIDKKILSTISMIFNVDESDLDENASSDTIVGWDSVGHMNLIIALEEEFDTSFSDEEVIEMINFKLIKLIISEHG